ncbi:MAG: DUF1801 domain-containing protein [Saprospiraceae bacterium]|nr:DUF1801 domain-containing protein [Saprospiraceae bacterium]
MPATHHVNLGFNYGADLPDPHHLLEGTGKLFRHVKIKSVEQLKDKNLTDLIVHSTTYKVPPIEKIILTGNQFSLTGIRQLSK